MFRKCFYKISSLATLIYSKSQKNLDLDIPSSQGNKFTCKEVDMFCWFSNFHGIVYELEVGCVDLMTELLSSFLILPHRLSCHV